MTLRKFWFLILPILYVYIAYHLYNGRYQLIDFIINSMLVFFVTLWMVRNIKHLTFSDILITGSLYIYLMVVHHLVTFLNLSQLLNVDFSHLTLNKNMINLEPLKTIHLTFRLKHIPPVMMRQIYGNVFLLAPLGYFILRLKTLRNPLTALLFICFFSIAIEGIQLGESYFQIAGRSTDIDDVLLNTLGGLLGIVIFMISDKVSVKSKKRLNSRAY